MAFNDDVVCSLIFLEWGKASSHHYDDLDLVDKVSGGFNYKVASD
jgi:hypothetical protein